MTLPPHVEKWLLKVFADANAKASAQLSRIPTIHEPTLDMAVIDSLNGQSAPISFRGGWTVRIDTHYLGGMRHFMYGERYWEIADIGLLVQLRQGGKPVWTKTALFQSKRLYADEIKGVEEDERADYNIGFGRLLREREALSRITDPRWYTFTEESRYRALEIGDGQWEAIRNYEESREIPVFYLLYNPYSVPWRVAIPHEGKAPLLGRRKVGCRVIRCEDLRAEVGKRESGQPSLKDARLAGKRGGAFAGWSLEDFVVREVIGCRQGKRSDKTTDESLGEVFYRRSGPIAAAMSVAIDAPEGYRVE